MKKVLQEGVLVALIGAALAFLANELSPRGLRLSRNYFPGAPRPLTLAATRTNVAQAGNTNAATSSETLAERLKAQGLQLVDSNQVSQLFQDPRCKQDLVVFVDSRSDEEYQKGHIPGAYQFNHYHPESYLPTILPLCQTAEQIVVYCNGGGSCEESEFAALFLGNDAGIPKQKLFVYAGGMTEWATNAMPVEIGGRSSGQIVNAK